MAQLEVGFIIVIVLGSVLLLMVLLFAFAFLLVLRTKRLLCFKRKYSSPFLLSDKAPQGGYKRNSKLPFDQKAQKKSKKLSKAGGKANNYQSFGRAVKFPGRDPFANKLLENPMVNMEDLDMDWTNPAFDETTATKFDAVVSIQSWYRMVRERIPYLQLKAATVLAQALVRGRKVRAMLPKLRKEKVQRDQLKKRHAGWKKKGTLAALKYYDVKAFGFAEVEQLYGMEIVRDAADQLRSLYGGKGKMKLKMFLSVKGIKLYHCQTMEHFATVKVSTISFCTLDPKNRKVFAFINRKKRRNFCHVFQVNENDAQKMVETMAEAFEVTFRRLEQQRKTKEREREEKIKKATFDHKSQQLEDEVASMLEMAETASSGMMERLSEMSSEDGGSLKGSREKLLASPERRPRARSSLVTSAFRAPPTLPGTPPTMPGTPPVLPGTRPSGLPRPRPSHKKEEPFDHDKLDEYFTGIKQGVDSLSISLEKDSQQSQMVSEIDKTLVE